tara:strand:+ start:9646 stop:11202 length:1557 start_codon:yes stop_codon:yes gene_type:complete
MNQDQTPKIGLSQLIDKFLSRELSDQLSSKENSLLTRTVGGTLGMFRDAAEYDYPDTALGWASMPAKGVTAMAEGMMGIPGAMIDDANAQVAGLSDGSKVTEGALGMFGSSFLGGGRGAGLRSGGGSFDDEIIRAAARSGMGEDVFANLARGGHVSPQIDPIGKMGKPIGFPTGYSGGLKLPSQKLQMLDEGLTTSIPDSAGQRGLLADIAEMEGKILVPMPGDRTSRDIISRIGGQDIDPYLVHGGYAYMPDVGGWASATGVINRYAKKFNALEEKGVGIGTPMAGTGSDYSNAGLDVLYKIADPAQASPKSKKILKDEINKKIGSHNKSEITKAKKKAAKSGKEYVPPEIVKPFAGFKEGTKATLDGNPLMRRLVMEALDGQQVSKLPDVPSAYEIRHAITDDRFRYLTRGDADPLSGFDMMSFSGNNKSVPTASLNTYQHPSYASHLQGDYLGGLEVPVPRTVLFPDFAKEMDIEGRPLSQHNYMFDRKKPTQELRPDVIEGILNFQNKIKSGQQ